jgi:hypothetical protein
MVAGFAQVSGLIDSLATLCAREFTANHERKAARIADCP